MHISSHLRHASELRSQARGLGLSFLDTLRFVASDYGARIGSKRVYSVRWRGMQVLLRSNRVDCRLMSEVFAGCYPTTGDAQVRTILDLGANIGLAAVYFHQLYPQAKIACVEPSPQNAAILKEIVARNELPVEVLPYAIGPERSTVQFQEAEDPSCSVIRDNGNISVTQVTLPEVMEQLGWSTIDLLKVDIEGWERALFGRNADWLQRVSCIVGEIHEGYDAAALRTDLQPHGFSVELAGAKSDFGQQIFRARKT
jgi:FkbM family methyltransferase